MIDPPRIQQQIIRVRNKPAQGLLLLALTLGGGAFAVNTNFELIENNGVTVWLDCPFSLVEERVRRSEHRPLARDLAKLQALYEQRRPAYSRADFRIDVEGDDPAPVVADILRLPIF